MNTERGERGLVKQKYQRVKTNHFLVQEPWRPVLRPFSRDQCCVLLCFVVPYRTLKPYVSNGIGALRGTAG